MKRKAKIFLPFLASALLLSCVAGTGNEQTVEIPPAVPAMGVVRVPSSETADSAAVGNASGSSVKTESGEKTEVVLERDLLVCIDPGHGFEDGGSGASEASFYPDGTLEKDVTITVATLLKDALDWRFENGKYICDFPARNAEGLKTFDEMYAFPTTRFEDANKPPQVDNWFPGQVFYDETTGETSYGWDRWDSTKEVFKKYGAIYRGDESRKVCYLTFDCGYEIGMTASLLDTLKEKEAPGTFFVTGPFVRGESADFTKEYMHSLTRRMLDEGHIVGSHTNTHPDMTMLTAEEAADEMRQVEADFAREFPDAPELLFFRPPAGAVNEWLIRLEAKLGYRTVTWSATYRDYVVDDQWAYEDALNLLKSCLHPGCVYLLHTESATNAALLPELIDWIRAQGYVIEPLCGIGT